MTLRNKVFLVFLTTFLSLIAVYEFSSHYIFLNEFSKLEIDHANEDLQRLAHALDGQFSMLSRFNYDWAVWDDTYAFMENRSSKYVHSNLVEEVFENLKLNLIAYLDENGELVHVQPYNFEVKGFAPLSSSLKSGLKILPNYFHDPAPKKNLKGFLSLPEGVLMLVAHPILTSREMGPGRGFLVMGRFIDANLISSLSSQIELEVNMVTESDPYLPPNIPDSKRFATGDLVTFVKQVSDNQLASYLFLPDLSGLKAFTLRVLTPRDIFAEGQRSVTFHTASVLLAGAVFSIILLVFLEKRVLARLAKLSEESSHIGQKGDLARRVSLSGNDELASLARDINSMLAALEDSQQDLRDREERYRAVMEQSSDGIFLLDPKSWEVLEANASFAQMTGYGRSELTALTLTELAEESWPKLQEESWQLISKAIEFLALGEHKFRRKDGGYFFVELNASLISFTGREVVCGIVRDVSERKKAQQELQREREFLQTVIDGVVDPILIIGANYHLLAMNNAARKFLSDPNQPVESILCHQLLHSQEFPCSETQRACPLELIGQNQEPATVMHHFVLEDGTKRVFEIEASPLFARTGDLQGVIESFRDVTDFFQAQEQLLKKERRLNYLANHDSLTGLPNRMLFFDRLQQALGNARRHGKQLALLYLDVDGFKAVNDQLGHAAGDSILCEVAHRLKGCLRETDTVARLGGDEFVVILSESASFSSIERVAEKICESLSRPIYLAEQNLNISASIGISIYPTDSSVSDELVCCADSAMYRSKGEGGNCFTFYASPP